MKKSTLYYLSLIILSIVIASLEFVSESASLQVMAVHMVFHSLFFLGLLVGAVERFEQKWMKPLTIVLLLAYTIYRATDVSFAAEPITSSLWILVAIIVLLSVQSILLHAAGHSDQKCEALCHVAAIHIWGDVAITVIILVISLGNFPASGAIDQVISGIALIGMWWVALSRMRSSKKEEISVV